MATGPVTQIADVVVPEIFTPYIQQLTEDKSRLIRSGALVRNSELDRLMIGGGLTFNIPSFRDLDNDADNVATDDVADIVALSVSAGVPSLPSSFNDSIAAKIETDTEIAVRMNRNKSWSSMDLTAELAGVDPMDAIARRIANYWDRRLQAAFIATWNGVIKDNTANDSGDYTNDVSGGSFVDGVTNFTSEAVIDAGVTMGDSLDDLGLLMVHSVVYARMQKNNLIDFIPDARGEIEIPMFLGRVVVVDDGMPVTSNVYDSWLFGAGATQFGNVAPKVATAMAREEAAGNGGGQETLYSRQQWTIHPVGHAYTGTAANGGPGNGTGSNDLNNATSWNRVYPERKQIKFARLVTREA